MQYDEFIRAVEGALPGWEGQKNMNPTYRSKVDMADILDKNPRRAGVLVHAHGGAEGMELLYMKRPQSMGNHSGQISFPGGVFEEGDGDLQATAFREAQEEVGLCAEQTCPVRALSWLYIPPSNFYVEPYLSVSEAVPDLNVNAAEVEYTFSIPVALLKSGALDQMVPIETTYGRMKVPAYVYEGEVIWGATAMITAELLALIS